jgi:uncharacterized membrane protein YagU involved in acid resistance
MDIEAGVGKQIAVALLAGLTAAALTLACVLPLQYYFAGMPPEVVFQGVASAAMGKSALTSGAPAVWLGVAFHMVISIIAATTFVLAIDLWPQLLRRPIINGLLYGITVFLVMTFVIVPMSAIGFIRFHSVFAPLLSLAVHMIAFGLPISALSSILLAPPIRTQSTGAHRVA